MKSTVKTGLIISMSLILFCSCITGSGDGTENHITPGDQIPEFSVPDAENVFISSADFRGKRSLLVFFISTCPDCTKVMPLVQQVYDNIREQRDCQVIPIARGESIETITAYWNDTEAHPRYTMKPYFDFDRTVFSQFANKKVPRLYIINSDGVVEWMAVEYLPEGMTATKLTEMLCNGAN